MRVQNFEDEFYPTTLEEGKQLYKNDAIVDFDIPSFNIFDIVVQGSALYKVRIGVDEKKDDTI